MIDFVMHAEIPFNKFEDPYFEAWMQTLQPSFNCVGRQTVRNDCLKKFRKMKEELQNEFMNLDSRVCLTSDMWTSVQNLGYMVITAHYITADFKLMKKIISFKNVKYPHTGFAIEEAIVSCLTEWGIREKLFTVTVDNASNNTNGCEELVHNHRHELLLDGVHLHIRCCAHILNILVQDGMKVIHVAISKIRELLKHIDSSPSRVVYVFIYRLIVLALLLHAWLVSVCPVYVPFQVLVQRVSIHCERRKRRASQVSAPSFLPVIF
jgi:hypothetical protein